MCNRDDVATIRGSSRDVLGVFVMFKNLAAIPSIVGYRMIILLGRTMSHDVAQCHTSHDVPQCCAMIVRRRVMVVRWSCVRLQICALDFIAGALNFV